MLFSNYAFGQQNSIPRKVWCEKNALNSTSLLSKFSYFAIEMFLRIFQFGNWYCSRIANVKFGFRVTQSVTTLLVGNNYATTNTTVFQLQFYTQKKELRNNPRPRCLCFFFTTLLGWNFRWYEDHNSIILHSIAFQ